MPPQMGSYGACDVLPTTARASRRTLTKASTAPVSRRTQRGKAGSGSNMAGKSAKKRELKIEKKASADSDAEMQARVGSMQAKYGEELGFLVTEFTQLEAELAPEVERCNAQQDGDGGEDEGNEPHQQLGRLRYFIAHVKNTTDRMDQAKHGLHHYTAAQLDMLEEHITERLLPVKERMLAQLAQRPASVDEEQTDQATRGIVSDSDSRERTTSGDSDVSDSWIAATQSAGVDQPQPGDGSNVGQMARPCSTLSLADLGDLCGDADGDDCGGAFLVDADCDNDAGGPGMGLDLLDLTFEERESPFLSSPRDSSRGAERSASMSTLSSVSAMTDEEFSDDSLSVDANINGACCEENESNECGAGAAGRSKNGKESTAIDQEMGELSELFAPDAFLLGTVLDSEDEAANSVRMVASITAVEMSESLSGDASELKQADQGTELSKCATAAAVAESSKNRANAQPVGIERNGEQITASSPKIASSAIRERENADSLRSTVLTPAVTSAAGGAVAMQKSSATVVKSEAVTSVSPLRTAAAHPPAVSASAAVKETAPPIAVSLSNQAPSWRPTTTIPQINNAQVRKTDCKCGEASCPSSAAAMANRKRPSDYSVLENKHDVVNHDGSGFAGATRSGMQMPEGMPLMHVAAPRQRKRQRSLAPILSAPRMIAYECSLCKESYQVEVSSNPWWSLLRQECPRCHRTQIPRVDAASAATSVDYIHAICAEEGEGCDSDGYGSESCSDSEADDDEEDKEGIGCFDTDVVAGDSSCMDGAGAEGRLSTAQASRLLVLMAHARTCPGQHANAQHAEVCRSTKFLMLHIRDCTGRGPSGEPCEHRWCRPCKSLLSHLVRCPQPDTCRICTPLDLPGPLRRLRELNVAQARAAVTVSSRTISPRCSAVVKTESCCVVRQQSASALPQ